MKNAFCVSLENCIYWTVLAPLSRIRSQWYIDSRYRFHYLERVITISVMNNKTKFKRRDDSNIIRFGDIASRYCHIRSNASWIIERKKRGWYSEIDNSIAERRDANYYDYNSSKKGIEINHVPAVLFTSFFAPFAELAESTLSYTFRACAANLVQHNFTD